jgi:hypothetical protein
MAGACAPRHLARAEADAHRRSDPLRRAWVRVLQGNGVSEDERHKLITAAAQRDLKSS